MKKYLLFAGTGHHPYGGACDFKSFGDDIESLKQLYASYSHHCLMLSPWGHICESETMEIVCAIFPQCGKEAGWKNYE